MPQPPHSLNIIRRPLNILFSLPTKFILILFTLFIGIEGFNVDTKNAQIHRRPNTGFGYTVDFAYRDSRNRKLT
ncbi:unnamed protein product [Meloidogyne enterolobii]